MKAVLILIAEHEAEQGYIGGPLALMRIDHAREDDQLTEPPSFELGVPSVREGEQRVELGNQATIEHLRHHWHKIQFPPVSDQPTIAKGTSVINWSEWVNWTIHRLEISDR